MPKLMSKIFTPSRIANMKFNLKVNLTIFGILYILYRFVFYKTDLGDIVRFCVAYFISDPLQAIANVLVFYGVAKLVSKFWWWAIIL